MTRHTPLWLQSGSYAAAVDRQLPGALWPSARCDGCAVTFAAAMSVNVDAGKVAVPVAGGGSVVCPSDAVEQVTLPAAPASGTDRIDLIVCHAYGNDLDGGVRTEFAYESVQGADGGAAPVAPPNSVALAQIRLVGGSAAIDPALITDVRPGTLATSGGASQPPYTGAGIGSYVDASGEVWVAKVGVYGGAWKRARDALTAGYHRNAAYSISQSPGSCLVWDGLAYDPYGLHGGNGRFACPVAGIYSFTFQGGGQTTANGQYVQAQSRRNDVVQSAYNGYGSQTVYATYAGLKDQLRCNAGDTVSGWFMGQIAMTGLAGPAAYASFHYLGTG